MEVPKPKWIVELEEKEEEERKKELARLGKLDENGDEIFSDITIDMDSIDHNAEMQKDGPM